jgi:hypothetical protein
LDLVFCKHLSFLEKFFISINDEVVITLR